MLNKQSLYSYSNEKNYVFENLLMKKITCHISINKMPKASLKSKKSQSEPVKIGNNKPCNILIGIHTYLSSTTLFFSHFWIKRRQSPKLKIYWINETLKSSLEKKSQSEPVKIGNNKPCNLIGIDTLVINNWSRAVYNHNYLPVNSRVDKTSNTQFELWQFGFTVAGWVKNHPRMSNLFFLYVCLILGSASLTVLHKWKSLLQ